VTPRRVRFDRAPCNHRAQERSISSASDSHWDHFDREQADAAEEPIKVDRF
jgi:hypothetical protein